MTTRFEEFRKLHYNETPLLLGNVWNVQSALQYEKLGFKALGTSSAAIASDLGYEDGENMPFEDYFFMIRRIKSAVKIPLSVDLEAGYGDTVKEIVANISRLYEIGIVGINIEDSVVINSKREITETESFATKLKAIVENLKKKNIDMFINVRSDVFLLDLPNKMEESKYRLKQYEKAGIDGVFLPCITNENDIKEIAAIIKLPLNVMCMPNLSNFEKLKELGVKRISMGNFANAFLNKQLEKVTLQILERNSFSPIFE
ncbi:isocitrate lyase/PEP mutase family protein [Flavobacterium tyrosinilyticum]|uniref:isocitrate lyase/PEP mutase family protein n=1 Tax=Flavobacterium tyrosinilyticum TaxID=1658740 RepID=UPI00202F5CDF|nr:isocitrate lyase/phosphoenolpyruvate mutase family protein [Flavobacterium tyrosinilyticum]MCM0665698.1 isocitrate lyase/phosphoenolpyruvate mutase family protein [Flavobacterium tyrosinilyticum]